MATERASRIPAQTMFDALVVESIVETPDTRTLVLDVGPHAPYRAGQYVSIDPHQFPALGSITAYLEHVKGRVEVPRAYSMCSAPHERYVAITIKEEVYHGQMAYPPLLSGFLVHQVRAGDRSMRWASRAPTSCPRRSPWNTFSTSAQGLAAFRISRWSRTR